MPVVTREEAQLSIEIFQNDLCEIQNIPGLSRKKKNYKLAACYKKITRWKKYLNDMKESGEDTFQYRFSGVKLTKEQAYINGVKGGRPQIYSPDELKERVREQRRVCNKRYQLSLKEKQKKA
jgi:hypothetical protein